LIFIHSIY